jgi:hypothetical protein
MAVECYITGRIVSENQPYGLDTICESCVTKESRTRMGDISISIPRCIYSGNNLEEEIKKYGYKMLTLKGN